jgi:uncharacterized membrane protein YhhN
LAVDLNLHAVIGPLVLSALAVPALVLCEYRLYRPGRYLFKPLAAMAFLWLAIAAGATGSVYGQWILAGLVCCMAGDLLLMPDSERWFLAAATCAMHWASYLWTTAWQGWR